MLKNDVVYLTSEAYPDPYVSYIVHVKGHGWTDGIYRCDRNSPAGWCHKWAIEFDEPDRGVIAFCKPSFTS